MSFRIVVDERERNSRVPKFLIEDGAQIDFARLSVGDYIIAPEIAIERKTISDLINSIYDGRLFIQCSDLIQFYSKPILLIEGNILNLQFENFTEKQNNEIEITVEKILQIYDALATVALIFRIPIIHSPSANYTSKFLIILLNKAIKSGITINGPLIKRIKKGNHIQLQQLSILSSLPGVGDKLAIKLLKKFGTPSRAINASISELSLIPGFGKARAEKVKKILNSNLNDDNTKNQQETLNF
ncbi:MAG TPA: ERCC4 domain-containing protein [Nitrososphaeraceae archaeon]|nr:ERCC4 domain-containing protein [Nitrososphaeraceae archaeon]